jgi:hypothetical protein
LPSNPLIDLRAGAVGTPVVTVSMLGMADLLWTVDGDAIQVRSKDTLDVIAAFGSTGAGNNQFSGPTHLANDLYAVYVNDAGNSRIKKHVGTTLAFHSLMNLVTISLPAVSNIAVDKRRCLMGEAATNTHVYDRHKNSFSEEHAYFDCGAGGIVGLAAIQDYFIVSDATRVEKRLIADGSLVASWNSLPAGFAVAGLASDGSFVYVLCTKAATDAKIVKLYVADLFEHLSVDLTGKQDPYAICCDAASIFFTNVGDTTVNRIDNDLDFGSLASVTDITTPRGICCLPGYFTALPAEPVGDFTGAGTMGMAGAAGGVDEALSFRAAGAMPMTGAAVVVKTKGFSAAGTMSMAGAVGSIAPTKKFTAAGSMAMTGAADVVKVAGFAAAGTMPMTGAAVIEKGVAQVGLYPAVAATLGAATDVAAVVAW